MRPEAALTRSSGALRAGTRNGSQKTRWACVPWPCRWSQAAKVSSSSPRRGRLAAGRAEAQEGEGQGQRRGQAEGAEPGAAGAGEHQHVEALLDAEVAPHPQLLDELQEARVAAEDRVLAAVHLDVAELEGGGLAAEQAAALHQGHPPALALQGERGGEAGEPRSDHRDVADGVGTPCARGLAVRARLLDHGAHRARPAVVEEAHERSITPAFSPEESRTRCRSGSAGSASMRSRMPL